MRDAPTLGDGDDDDVRSVEAQRMQSALEERLFATAPQPVKVGRFVLADVIGRGGSGVVYRAIDVDLDRVIAVKLLASNSDLHHSRLVREAKVLARLNHPHVVAIYEVGEHRGELFLAMEYVDGGSLAHWCARRPQRTRADVAQACAMLEQCARGLIAAHAAGIVHRDLKPGNILIGTDGRARLADFGLARTDARLDSGATTELPLVETRPPCPDDPLTRTGAVLGTPAYMAPEQLRGHADERSDQFGLCAAFFEALWGMRAYAGDDLATLFESLKAGRITTAPVGLVPDHVRRVLLRGLSPAPEHRFASVDELLAALERGRRRRRVPMIAGGLATLATGMWLALGSAADPIPACGFDRDALDTAWGPARREAVQTKILASEAPYAPSTWTKVSGHLDTLAQRWQDGELDACRQARDPDPERAALGVARMACGAHAIATFDAATAALVDADDEALANAVLMTDALGDLTDCTATSARGPDDIGSDEGLRLAVMLDRALLLRRLNQREHAEQLVDEVFAAIEPGTLPRLRASAQLARARQASDRSDRKAEREALSAALTDAELADDAPLMARAWSELAVAAAGDNDREGAMFFLERAKRLEQQGRLGVHARAWLLEDEARVDLFTDHFGEAVVVLEGAVALLEAQGDDRLDHATLLMQLAEALEYAGNITEAIAVGERGVARFDALVGADHPFAAAQRARVARMYGFVEQEQRGESELEKALAVLERNPTYRPDLRAVFYDDLAQSQANLGKYDDGLANVERAIVVLRELHGADSPRLAMTLATRSRLLLDRGEPARAIIGADEALALLQRDTPDDMKIGELQLHRAEVLARLGPSRVAEARVAVDDARTRLANVYPANTAFDFQTLQRAATVYSRLGDETTARQLFEDGLARATRVQSGSYVGRFHLDLAHLDVRASEVADAREHLAHSRAAYLAIGSPQAIPQPILAEIDAMEKQLPR